MAQNVISQQQQGIKFGLSQENRKTLMHLFGSVPSYFEKIPSALGGLFVDSMSDLATFKSSIPKKYEILALYTQSLTLRDEYKQYLYEKLLNVFGVTEEEKFFVIESISFINTLSIFQRMTLIQTSKDAFQQSNSNAIEYVKKVSNQDNNYDPTALNRTQNPEYGLSSQNEDQCLLQFGTIPLVFNRIPRSFAENLWKKWMLMGQVEIPKKIKFLIISIIYGTSSIKGSFDKDSVMNFIKLAMTQGLTKQELIEIAAIQAFRIESTIWMRSTHYSLEEFIKVVDILAAIKDEQLKINRII